MAQALGLGLGLPFCAATGGAAPALAAAPYYDDFAGAAASLNARAVPVGSPAISWTAGADDSSTTGSLRLDGSGRLIGRQAGSWFFTTMELDPGVSAGKWYRAEMSMSVAAPAFNGNGAYLFIDHSVGAAGSQQSTRFQYSTDGAGLIQFAYAVNGSNTSGGTELLHTNTDSAGRGVVARAGDVFELRKKTVAGQIFVEPYYNGQIIGPDMRIDTLGVAINDKLALKGALPNTGELDAVMIGDPALHGLISAYVPRVPQINADGSVGIPLTGDYAGAAPSLTWTLYDASTGTAITGYVDQPFSGFSTGAAKTASSAGSWSGKCPVAAGKIGSNGAYIIVKRSGLASGATFSARTGVFTPGQVALMYGQSLTTKMWAEGYGGVTFTPPANGWVIDGAIENNGASGVYPITSPNRKTQAVNSPLASWQNPAWMAYQLNQVAGADKPMSMIRGGMGGTFYHERLPSDPLSTGIWAAALDGIRLAGGDVAWVFDAAGEYEAQGATGNWGYTMPTFDASAQAGVIADIQAIYDALDALTGRPCKVVVRPVGAVFTAPTARCEAMRRLQWKLTQDYPSRYILGGYGMDQQHNTATDQYHLATYQEQGRRMIYAMAKALGYVSFDRNGPMLYSVTAWSDTSVTVRLNKNGASSLEVVNTTGTLTDYRGGLTFATDSGFTAEKIPTAVGAPVDIDATYAEITWTFAAGSFPTKPYVRGPYGANPFNRTNNTTINGAIQTQGSMVRGVFAGEPQNIPVQPYYSAAGDYIVGS